jgi:uncharacterized protein (TIRG00374 family)
MSSTGPTLPQISRTTPKRDLVILGGLLALFVIGFAGLAATIGWEETMSQLRSLSFVQLLTLLALSMVNYSFRGLRWHLFARQLGLPLSVGQNVLHFMGGFAMTVTPGRIGELVRLRWISRLTDWPFERLLPLPFTDRIVDIAAMGTVLGGGVVLSQSAHAATAIPVALVALVFAAIVTKPGLLGRIVTFAWRATGRWPRRFVGLRRAARSMALFRDPKVILPALVLSLIGWTAEGYALYLLLSWMGADIGIATATVVFIFSTLAGGLTGAPGGVGGAEAAMLMMLSAQAVPLAIALPAMAIIRVTTLWFAILVGLLSFPVAEHLSKKA